MIGHIWIAFCDEASDDEKSAMTNDIVAELQKQYYCKVTAVGEKIQLNIE